MIRCFPVFGRVKHAAHAGIKHHRIGRHVRRVASASVSKPAIVGWLCTAVAGGAGIWGLGWPELARNGFPSGFGAISAGYPQNRPGNGTENGISGGSFPVEFFPPEAIAEMPPGVLPAVEIIEQRPIGTTAAQPVPEPSSLGLLAAAVAAFLGWRTRA